MTWSMQDEITTSVWNELFSFTLNIGAYPTTYYIAG